MIRKKAGEKVHNIKEISNLIKTFLKEKTAFSKLIILSIVAIAGIKLLGIDISQIGKTPLIFCYFAIVIPTIFISDTKKSEKDEEILKDLLKEMSERTGQKLKKIEDIIINLLNIYSKFPSIPNKKSLMQLISLRTSLFVSKALQNFIENYLKEYDDTSHNDVKSHRENNGFIYDMQKSDFIRDIDKYLVARRLDDITKNDIEKIAEDYKNQLLEIFDSATNVREKIKQSMIVLDNEEKSIISLMQGKISLWADTPMVLSD